MIFWLKCRIIARVEKQVADKIKQVEIAADTRNNDGATDDYPGKRHDRNGP